MRTMFAWPLVALLAWFVAPPPAPAPQPVRVADVQWCRMPAGLGDGPALLVRFEVERDWHMYWMNPGDSGAPPTVKAPLPQGWRFGQPVWPRPRVLQTDGERLFVHEGTWGWLLPLECREPDAQPDFATELSITWMACRQTCTVGKASVKVAAPAGTLPPCPLEVGGSPFPLAAAEGDSIRVVEGRLKLAVGARGRMSAAFLQATDPGVTLEGDLPVPMPVRDGVATLETAVRVRPQDAAGQTLALRGLVLLGDRPGDPCVWVGTKSPIAATPAPVAP